eukprot:COSAG01_NODE_33687_length_560_cov_1.145336_2_plen_26_part_01
MLTMRLSPRLATRAAAPLAHTARALH